MVNRVKARRAGFTLIELMVTVAIIGIGMTIVFLEVDTLLPGSRLKSASKEIVTILEQLRGRAIFRSMPCYLEYDVEFNGYRAYFPYIFDDKDTVAGPGRTEIIDFTPLSENVEITDIAVGFGDAESKIPGKQTIAIKVDGSVTAHIVHLRNVMTNQEMSVRISSLTGFAEIFRGRIEYREVSDDSF